MTIGGTLSGALIVILALVLPAFSQDEVPVISFGDWRIIYIKPNNTYVLRGASKAGGYIDLQCHPNNSGYGIQIPLWKLIGRKNSTDITKTITIWTDNSDPIDITLPLYKGIMLIGLTTSTWTRDDVLKIVETMGVAKQFFAFSYDGTTLQFDTAHLPAARRRFAELCSKL